MFVLAFLGRAATILVFAWFAGRLLGATRLSWKTILTAGVIGYGCNRVLVFAFGWSGEFFLLELVFTMMAIVGIELFSRPGRSRLVLKPPSIPRPVRALRKSIQLARRSAKITGIAVRHGLGSALGLTRRGGGGGDVGALARRGRDAMEEAGGTFVKLGQLLSTRVDLIPPSAAKEFTKLQEQVAPANSGAIRLLLETELERPVTEIFSEFEWQPIAAASIAQVHLARLHSGETVVVKVQRPGIADTIEQDLTIIARLARIAEGTVWGAALGISAFVADFSNGLREELDFGIEARNISEVAVAVAHLEEIRIPKVYDDLSTLRVLVMERLEGVSVGQAGSIEALGLDGEKLARLMLRAEMEPMFGGERFHADPHPGNVIVLDDGRLGLVDLGATGRLDTFEQASIADMLMALRQRDPALLREATMEVATARRSLDPRQFERALAQFMARHLSPGATPSAAMLNELMQVFLAFGIALPATTTTMFRALVTLEGTLEALSPGFPIIDAAQDIAAELVRGRFSSQSLQEQVKEEMLRLAPILQRVPRHLDRIATLIERGEITIRVSLFSDESDVAVIARLVNRAVLALLGSALGLLSVILLGTPGGPLFSDTVSFFDVLGYIGLYGGAVLILRAVLAAVRDESG
jgi:ubiquinone biosynthesis protein